MNGAMQTALQNIRDFLNHRTPRLLSVPHYPEYRQCPDSRRMVELACDIIARDQALPASENVLPSFYPDYGTVSMPAVFGGEVFCAPGTNRVYIKPVARAVGDVLKLAPKPFEETDYQRALDMFRVIRGRLATDDVYLRMPDLQGPVSTLAMLFEDQAEMMVAMIEQPEAVHEALRRVTDVMIAIVSRFRAEAGPEKVIGPIWPHISLPDGKGIGITQDYMPLLGPDLYKEFELPCLKRISDAFGGVFIHCCGGCAWHFDNLATSGVEVIGFECCNDHAPMEELFAAFGQRIAINSFGNRHHRSLADYLRSFKGTPMAIARFWFTPCQGSEGLDDLRRAMDEL